MITYVQLMPGVVFQVGLRSVNAFNGGFSADEMNYDYREN